MKDRDQAEAIATERMQLIAPLLTKYKRAFAINGRPRAEVSHPLSSQSKPSRLGC